MLNKRMFSLILFFANLVLISFIMIRSGSADYTPPETKPVPLIFIRLPQPPGQFTHSLTLWDFESKALSPAISSPDSSCRSEIVERFGQMESHALQISCLQGGTIALSTAHIPGEWTRYDTLYIDADNETGRDIILFIQLDPSATARDKTNQQGYSGRFTIGMGPGTIAVPMDDIRKDINGIPLRQTIYLHFPAIEDKAVYLDNIRVVRHDD